MKYGSHMLPEGKASNYILSHYYEYNIPYSMSDEQILSELQIDDIKENK